MIQERTLEIAYIVDTSRFDKLLENDDSVFMHAV